jgi:hypothetical protein
MFVSLDDGCGCAAGNQHPGNNFSIQIGTSAESEQYFVGIQYVYLGFAAWNPGNVRAAVSRDGHSPLLTRRKMIHRAIEHLSF